MLTSEIKTIDGISFEVTQFPAMRGFALLAKLLKLLGPAIGALGSVQGISADTDISAIGPALSTAFMSLDPDQASALALDILKCTAATISDEKGMRRVELSSSQSVDLVFSSRLKTMLQVLVFAVQVNYRDFFSGSVPSAPTIPKAAS